jgi:hypothetical protein
MKDYVAKIKLIYAKIPFVKMEYALTMAIVVIPVAVIAVTLADFAIKKLARVIIISV